MIWKLILLALCIVQVYPEVLGLYDFGLAVGEVITDISSQRNALVVGDSLSSTEGAEALFTENGIYLRSTSYLSFPPNAVRLNFLDLTDTFHLMFWVYPQIIGNLFSVDDVLTITVDVKSLSINLNSGSELYGLSSEAARWIYLVIQIAATDSGTSTVTIWEDDYSPQSGELSSTYERPTYRSMTVGGTFVGYIYQLELNTGTFDGSIVFEICVDCSFDCLEGGCIETCYDLEEESICGLCSECSDVCISGSTCISCSPCSNCYDGGCIDIESEYCAPSGLNELSCDWTTCGMEGCEFCSSSTECFACLEGYALLEDTSSCVASTSCPEGYLTLPGGYLMCSPCISDCTECTDATSCVTCADGSYITSHNLCEDCLESCNTCSLGDTCDSCNEGSYLSSESLCAMCLDGCIGCSSGDTCDSCVEELILTPEGLCDCPENSNFNEELGVCEPNPLSAIGTIEGEEIVIRFTPALMLPVSEANIGLSHFMPNHETVKALFRSSSLTESRITLEVGTMPEEIDALYIKFTNLQQDPDMEPEDVEVTVEGDVAAFSHVTEETDPPDAELEEIAQSIAEPAGTTLGSSLGAGSASLSITMYEFSALWSFVHAAQMFYFMPVQNIRIPASVRDLWQSFGAQIYELPNIAELGDAEESEEAPDKWHTVEFETTSLLWNTGEVLFIVLVTISFLPVCALGYLVFVRYPKVQKFFKKRMMDYKWCYFLRLGLEGYIEFVAAALFSTSGTAEIFFSICFLIVGVLSAPLIFWFLVKKQECIYGEVKGFKKHYGTLFEEFKLNHPVAKLMFYPLFCVRRLLCVFSLYFLASWPLLQVIMNVLGTGAVLAFLLIYKPFKEFEVQTITLVSEFVILFNFLLGALYLLDLSDEVSFVVFILVFASLGVMVGVAYFFVCQHIYKAILGCCRKKASRQTTVVPGTKPEVHHQLPIGTDEIRHFDSEVLKKPHCGSPRVDESSHLSPKPGKS